MLISRLNHLAVCHMHRARLYKIPNSDIKKTFIEKKSRRLEYGGSFMFYLLTSSVLFFQQLIQKKFNGKIVYLVSNVFRIWFKMMRIWSRNLGSTPAKMDRDPNPGLGKKLNTRPRKRPRNHAPVKELASTKKRTCFKKFKLF